MKRLSSLCLLPFVLAACGVEAGETPGSTTTIAPTTTTVPATTSSTIPADRTPPNITVWGSLVLYSMDGIVTVSGTLDEAGTVSIPGAAISVEGADGGTSWSADFEREPGVHDVTITAEDEAGNRSEVVLSLTVDPALEVVFAFATAFDGVEVTADYAVFLSGEEANLAAREDGAIGADETVPNDFYIRNDNPLLRTLSVSPAAPVILQTCFVDGPCVAVTAVSVSQWAELLAGGSPTGLPDGWQWYGGGGLPYWLTLQDGVVVQISEQYLP